MTYIGHYTLGHTSYMVWALYAWSRDFSMFNECFPREGSGREKAPCGCLPACHSRLPCGGARCPCPHTPPACCLGPWRGMRPPFLPPHTHTHTHTHRPGARPANDTSLPPLLLLLLLSLPHVGPELLKRLIDIGNKWARGLLEKLQAGLWGPTRGVVYFDRQRNRDSLSRSGKMRVDRPVRVLVLLASQDVARRHLSFTRRIRLQYSDRVLYLRLGVLVCFELTNVIFYCFNYGHIRVN